jgi:hypothetical protein
MKRSDTCKEPTTEERNSNKGAKQKGGSPREARCAKTQKGKAIITCRMTT